MKKIDKIVMYKAIEDGKTVVKSCIFYDDGSYEKGNEAFGVRAIKTVAVEKNIKNAAQLKEIINKEIVYTMTEKEVNDITSFVDFLDKDEQDEQDEDKKEEESNTVVPVTIVKESESIIDDDDEDLFEEESSDKEEEVVYEEDIKEDSQYTDFTKEETVEDEEIIEEETTKNTNALGCGIVALAVVGTIVATGLVISKCSKEGILKENIDTTTTTTTDTTENIDNNMDDIIDEHTYTLNINDNDLYNEYTFAELLNVTNNEFQKDSMVKVSSALTGFNNIYANAYTESGHDIKAALTFDEVVALQQAYNNYTTDEVRAYFNGYEVNAIDMSNAYKSASLQLMGAYTIETSENPVDMTILIDSSEGIDFYNRYHSMFLAAKEATGEEKIRLVNEFYKAVREDFSITEEVRTEGISHADDHSKLKDYQLAVAPMIASAEMLFQNLDTDYTLDDLEVDFMNDIGLCNHADDKFERLETITLAAYEDNTNPLYVQYRAAIIAELTKSGDYVIDDAHRELSKLRRFQEIVNGDPLALHKTTFEGEYGYSYTDYDEWIGKDYDYSEVVTIDELPIPEDEKNNVDNQIAQENEDAKKRAEEEAAQEAARQQEEADKEAKAIEDEIKEDEKQLEEDIKDINETIDGNNKDTDSSNNKPVNENDYNNIDFDDEHSDEQGNLDDSVRNVTTDGTGANKDLPDPNVTGRAFDAKSADYQINYSYEDIDGTYVEYTGYEDAYTEYDEDYVAYDADGNPLVSEEEVYQYTR